MFDVCFTFLCKSKCRKYTHHTYSMFYMIACGSQASQAICQPSVEGMSGDQGLAYWLLCLFLHPWLYVSVGVLCFDSLPIPVLRPVSASFVSLPELLLEFLWFPCVLCWSCPSLPRPSCSSKEISTSSPPWFPCLITVHHKNCNSYNDLFSEGKQLINIKVLTPWGMKISISMIYEKKIKQPDLQNVWKVLTVHKMITLWQHQSCMWVTQWASIPAIKRSTIRGLTEQSHVHGPLPPVPGGLYAGWPCQFCVSLMGSKIG